MSQQGPMLNSGVCRDMIKLYYFKLRKGYSTREVLMELLHTVYAQGYRAGVIETEKKGANP
jgi:hypothetical protein